MNRIILLLFLLSYSNAFGWGGITYLPAKSQKLMVSTSSVYTPTASIIVGLHHFDIDISLPIKDGGSTYTGIVSNFDVVYPFFGNVRTSQQYNFLNNSAFTFVDHGGGSYSATGYLANGTTQYLDTGYTPSVNETGSSGGLVVFERTNRGNPNSGASIGAIGTNSSYMAPLLGAARNYGGVNSGGVNYISLITSTAGLWVLERLNASNISWYLNGTLDTTIGAALVANTNYSLFVGAINQTGTAAFYSALNTDFSAVLNAPLGTKNTELYTIVTNLNTAWGR